MYQDTINFNKTNRIFKRLSWFYFLIIHFHFVLQQGSSFSIVNSVSGVVDFVIVGSGSSSTSSNSTSTTISIISYALDRSNFKGCFCIIL